MPEDRRRLEREYSRLEAMRGDSAFLRSVGIVPCAIGGRIPEFRGEPRMPLTERDARWLGACGVAWEREPAAQLALDFGERCPEAQGSDEGGQD